MRSHVHVYPHTCTCTHVSLCTHTQGCKHASFHFILAERIFNLLENVWERVQLSLLAWAFKPWRERDLGRSLWGRAAVSGRKPAQDDDQTSHQRVEGSPPSPPHSLLHYSNALISHLG